MIGHSKKYYFMGIFALFRNFHVLLVILLIEKKFQSGITNTEKVKRLNVK